MRTNRKCTALLFFSTFLRQRCHIFIQLQLENNNRTKFALNSSQNFKTTVQHLIKVFPSFLHPLCPMWVQGGTFICPFIVQNWNI